MTESDWRSLAACRGLGPEVFEPIQGHSRTNRSTWKNAVKICDGCSVVSECLESAIEEGDAYLYRGGMTPLERMEVIAKKEAEEGKGVRTARQVLNRLRVGGQAQHGRKCRKCEERFQAAFPTQRSCENCLPLSETTYAELAQESTEESELDGNDVPTAPAML